MNTRYTISLRSVKAKKLKDGQWLHFPDSHDMLIDDVSMTRDGDIKIRCGYRPGDDSATMFFNTEERVLVRN